MSNIQKYTNHTEGLEFSNDFGSSPLGLAHFTDDKAIVSVITGLGAFISCAYVGPIGLLLAGTIALNDFLYLNKVDNTAIKEEQETINPQTITVASQTVTPQQELVNPIIDTVPVPVAVKPTFQSAPTNTIAAKPSFQSAPTKVIESFVPQLAPIDVAQMLADDLYSNAIMSPSCGGKGMLVSNALRKIKASKPDIHIFLVDPKDDEKERGYWDGVVDTWCRCDFNSMRSQSKTDFLEGVLDKYHSIQGPKLLIFDEATNVFGHLKNCSKELLSEVKSFLSGIASSGNSRNNFVWLVGHSGNLGDYGISGGEMSCFRKIYIAPMSNIEAIKQLGNTTFAGGKFGNEGVDYIKQVASQSEVNRAVYIGTSDSWEPMARLTNHSGYDRDSQTFTKETGNSSSDESNFKGLTTNFNDMLSQSMALAVDTDNMELFLELGVIEKSGESVKALKRLQEICLQVI